MKGKFYLLLIIVCVIFKSHLTFAGHGMALINFNVTTGATGITINASSQSPTCGGGPYWLQVEVRCTPGQLTGTPPSTMQTNLKFWTGPGVTYNNFPWYNSLLNVPNYTQASGWPDNCVVEPYNPVFISFAGLCPGQVYYFSAREWVSGTNTVGPWTAVQSFTVPGAFTPLNFNIAASPTIFCSPGCSSLSATGVTGGCGTQSILWQPGGMTTSSPVVCPAASTNYTCVLSTPCQTVTKTVSVTVVPAVSAAFTPVNSSTCVGTPVTFNHTGTAGVTHTWAVSPAAAISSTSAINPTITFPNIGSYTISHTVAIGSCTNVVSTNITINGVSPAFTANSYTQCLLGNSFTFSALTSTGSHTYNFSPAAGAPLAGTTSTYGPVSFSSGGTYTVTHFVNDGGCISSTNSVVVVSPQPTATASNNGPVCNGGALTLTGGGGGTYQWAGPNGFSSALQNPGIAVTNTIHAGVYTVTVDLNGCTDVASTTVTVLTPTASASNTGSYCAGSTIQLNTGGATSYTWSGPASFASNLQNPTIANSNALMSGIYTVNISFGACVMTATTDVLVAPLPSPTASNNSPVCEGQAVIFSGGGGVTYSWSGPAFSSAVANPTISVSSTVDTGIYTLTVTDANNCTNTITTNVVVNAQPLPTASNNGPVCTGAALNLSGGGGGTYQWSGPNAFSSAQQNPSVPSTSTLDAGVYTVTVSLLTCTAVASTTVIVTTPTASASNTGSYCAGATIQLNSSAGTGFSWSGPGGFSSALQNPVIVNSTSAMSGVYSVIVTIGSCTAAASTTVQVSPLPVPVLNSNSPVCDGSLLSFTGSGGTNYSWTGPAGFTSSSTSPSIAIVSFVNAGQYSLTVTDGNNCSNSGIINVTVNSLPVATASGTTVCENAPALLTAGGGISYSWQGPAGYTSFSQNPVIPSASLNSAGQYTVLVTDANTCTNTAVTSLAVNPAPTPNISSNSPICVNAVLNLSAGGGLTYAWSGPGGFTSSSQNPSFNANSVSYSGNYFVTVTDANNCMASISITATVNPLPVGNIVAATSKGCLPLCTNFTVQSMPQAANASWDMGNGGFSNGLTSGNQCYGATGIYTISSNITDVNGCSSVTTRTIEVYPQPVADFNHAPLKPIVNVDADVKFTDASHGGNIVSWNWYFMNSAGYQATIQNPSFTYQEPGDYVVALVVKNDMGCSDTLLKNITVGEDFGLYVPDAFTPNGDGVNDVFQPKGFGIVKYELQLFDRWGEKVFESNEFEKGWDGIRQKSNDVNYTYSKEEVYVWRIKATSVFGKAHEYTGHVTLIK